MGEIFRTDGGRRTREVQNSEAFVTAMNDRPDAGRVEVWIQIKGGELPSGWHDIACVWSGAWDPHHKPPLPSKRDLIEVAKKGKARFARSVIRSAI